MLRSQPMRRMVFAVLVSFSAIALVTPFAGAQVPDDSLPQAQSPSTLSDTTPIELVVPTSEGRIVWKDVAGSLATALRLDAPTVERIFPTGSLDLRSSTTILVLFGIDVALGDAASISVIRNDDGDPALRLRCDRNAIRFLASHHDSEPAKIHLDDDWVPRSTGRPLVVCLHGLKSEPTRFDDLRDFLRHAGYATAAVSYDDHQSMAASAAQISHITKTALDGTHQPKLVLIGHSMGGLVAREWTENPDLRNQSIVGLITVGSPHRGSNWASLPPLLDFFAEGKVDSSDIVDVLLHQPSAPGMRELAPESAFLTKLQSRPRRGDVRYTAIVGTGSPVSETEVAKLRAALQRLDEKSTTLRLLRPRIQPLLQSFDELVRGKGDGVVAVDRATIEGVRDVVSVELSHIDFFRIKRNGAQQPVWDAILERLKIMSEQPQILKR